MPMPKNRFIDVLAWKVICLTQMAFFMSKRRGKKVGRSIRDRDGRA